MSSPTTGQVRTFWEQSPLCASGIPAALGSPEFFRIYDSQREGIESIDFSYRLHEYPDFASKRVLDVGSGNGYVLAKYAAEGAAVYGVDVTETGVALCRRRFELQGLQGHFQVGDAQALPFADNSFDCVCSMGVLHHVPDTALAVSELFRVLRPGGRLIVMFYHRQSAKYQLKYRVWHWVTGKPMAQLVNEFDGVGNPKGAVYSRRELRALLQAFEPPELFVGFLETRDLVLRGARHLPDQIRGPLERRIGWNLYAKTRKPR